MSYLYFKESGTSESGKTKQWLVESNGTGTILAAIRWFGPWRKYTVQFSSQTVFDQACLREIADFIETQTREHKSK